jgi:hypothetical protein
MLEISPRASRSRSLKGVKCPVVIDVPLAEIASSVTSPGGSWRRYSELRNNQILRGAGAEKAYIAANGDVTARRLPPARRAAPVCSIALETLLVFRLCRPSETA